MGAKFLLKFNMAVIKEIPIPPNVSSLTVGRKPDNDIVIDDPTVSGHHARFYKIGNSYFIEDLNSTNGTFIKGKKILKAEIHNGDEINIARHSLVFVCEEEPVGVKEIPPETPEVESVSVSMPASVALTAEQKPQVHQAVTSAKVPYVRIIEGIVDKDEIELVSPVTYIGTEESAGIKIKPGGGIFGGSTGMVALISKRQDGFILKAMKPGYPKVNGENIEDQIELKDGYIIEAGKTKMIFSLREKPS
ncbi:MAG: FHA domain-containing protein [Endomicrobiia bacterium]